MNAITRHPLLRSAGLGGVSREFANRFAGLGNGVTVPDRAKWPVPTRVRGRRSDDAARVLWLKLREGKITDPTARAAVQRDHAAEFAQFDAELEATR